MSRRFLNKPQGSFKERIQDILVSSGINDDRNGLCHMLSNADIKLVKAFSSSLGVSQEQYLEAVMRAEIVRMVNIKNRRSSFEDVNQFFSEVSPYDGENSLELRKLVANYIPVPLNQLQHEGLVDHAKNSLGLRFSNYKGYRIASFDGKPSVEMIFYIDSNAPCSYQNAWLAAKGKTLRHLSFSQLADLSKYVEKIEYAVKFNDFDSVHVSADGLRYQ